MNRLGHDDASGNSNIGTVFPGSGIQRNARMPAEGGGTTEIGAHPSLGSALDSGSQIADLHTTSGIGNDAELRTIEAINENQPSRNRIAPVRALYQLDRAMDTVRTRRYERSP